MSIFNSISVILATCMLCFITGCKGQTQTSQVIDYPSLGILFEVPNQWVVQEVDNGYLLSNPSTPGFILLTTHDLKNMKAIQEELVQGFTLGPNSTLTAIEAPEKITLNTMGGQYTGTISSKPAKAYILGMLNKNGLGLTLICGANSNAYSDHLKNAGLLVAESVVFYNPNDKTIVITDQNESAEWKEKFKNCRLTYMESYNSYGSGGYGKKIKIDLCAKGYFNHSSYSSMSVDAGGYSAGSGSHKKGSGTWKMLKKKDQILLQLHFYKKEVYEYVVTVDMDDKTYLNGNRYFRTYEGAGKYSPKCD